MHIKMCVYVCLYSDMQIQCVSPNGFDVAKPIGNPRWKRRESFYFASRSSIPSRPGFNPRQSTKYMHIKVAYPARRPVSYPCQGTPQEQL